MRADEEEWAGLMRAAISGDAGAYRRFLEAISPVIRAGAKRNLARYGLAHNDAEDAVQETLLAIHLKRQTWDTQRPIGPWIAAISRNKLIDVLRRRGFHTQIQIEEVADVLADGSNSEGCLDRHDIDRMLERLNERQRMIVRSVSVEGSSVRETAQRLDMTEGAVRVTLHRALKTLAALFRRDNA